MKIPKSIYINYKSRKIQLWNSLSRKFVKNLDSDEDNTVVCPVTRNILNINKDYPLLEGILIYSKYPFFNTNFWYNFDNYIFRHKKVKYYIYPISIELFKTVVGYNEVLKEGRIYNIDTLLKLMNEHLNTDFICIIDLFEYLHKLLTSGKKINNIFQKYLHKEKTQEENQLKHDYEKILENNDIEKYTIKSKLDENKEETNKGSCVIC